MNPNSLVARVYKAKYYPHGDVLNASLGSRPSYAWRSIMQGLEVVKRGSRWRAGNGKLIHIWNDKWLPTTTTYKVASSPCSFNDYPMVSALIHYDTRRWRADLVNSIFLPFEAKTILNIPISYNLPEDKIIWVGNMKGIFTVKSVYYVALNKVDSSEEGESSYGNPGERLWKKVWHLNIPSKIEVFAWRACVDALPTMVNLKKRGIGENDFCPCCRREVESIFHSIIRCEVAKRVWDCWDIHFDEFGQELYDVSDVALQILDKRTVHDLEMYFGVAWSIWYNKNSVTFKSTCRLPSHIWGFAIRYLHEYRTARMVLNKKQDDENGRWTASPPGVFKVNVDGVTSVDGRNSSVGAIIRDSCWVVTAACCKYFQGHFSVAEVEALTMEIGILLARNMKISQVIIESDAASTVSDINAKFMDGSLGHLY